MLVDIEKDGLIPFRALSKQEATRNTGTELTENRLTRLRI